MARAIVRDAAVAPGEFVLEIGSGAGFLTLQLAELGVQVLAVEIDERLLDVARRVLEDCAPPGHPRSNVSWLRADALEDKHHLNPELVASLPASGPWHVVSNLPYSIGSPLLVLVSRLPNPPRSMTVLLQRESARRISAAPGGGNWGPLAVRLQLGYRCRILRSVPPRLFWPVPAVESNLLRLELRDERPAARELPALDLLLDELFQHRRQTLARLFARLLGERGKAIEFLASHGLDPSDRPEDLDASEILASSRDPRWLGVLERVGSRSPHSKAR